MTQYIWQDKKWPSFTWLDEDLIALLSKCRFLQGKLLGRAASLGLELKKEAQAEILTSEAIETSAIEGKTVSPDEVRSSVARRLGLPEAGVPPQDRYAEGLVDVLLDATANFKKSLSAERLNGWQAALFPTGYSGLHQIRVGKFRKESPVQVISGPVGREKVHYEAPPGSQVPVEIVSFLDWWESSKGAMDGMLRAGIAGFWFVTIHPYEDGNGRIARALTDMALAQDENLGVRFYSLSSQIMAEREDYYTILEKCQKDTLDITPWLIWFLSCFERAIVRSEKLISKVLIKARFWETHSRVSLTDRQLKVVSRLLDAGPGGFQGGMTNKKYVGMTKASRATAYREIVDLVDKGLLVQNQSKGRSVSYDLAWPDSESVAC